MAPGERVGANPPTDGETIVGKRVPGVKRSDGSGSWPSKREENEVLPRPMLFFAAWYSWDPVRLCWERVLVVARV